MLRKIFVGTVSALLLLTFSSSPPTQAVESKSPKYPCGSIRLVGQFDQVDNGMTKNYVHNTLFDGYDGYAVGQDYHSDGWTYHQWAYNRYNDGNEADASIIYRHPQGGTKTWKVASKDWNGWFHGPGDCKGSGQPQTVVAKYPCGSIRLNQFQNVVYGMTKNVVHNDLFDGYDGYHVDGFDFSDDGWRYGQWGYNRWNDDNEWDATIWYRHPVGQTPIVWRYTSGLKAWQGKGHSSGDC